MAPEMRPKSFEKRTPDAPTAELLGDWGQPTISDKIILGDPGAVSGGGKKSKRARKKIGQRKVKNEI